MLPFVRFVCFLGLMAAALACRSSARTSGESTSASTAGQAPIGPSPEINVAHLQPSPESAPEPLPLISGKPVFTLRLDIERCAHDVYVNGGLVSQNLEKDALHSEFPINHWLRSGKNEIEVHMIKPLDQPDECSVKAELLLRNAPVTPAGSPIQLLTLVHDAKTNPPQDPTHGSSPTGSFESRTGSVASHGDVRVGPASIVHLTGRGSHIHVLARSFEVKLGFPEWAFFKGERQLIDYEVDTDERLRDDYNALFATYMRLWQLLANRDVDGFVNACEERSREMDTAYYLEPGKTGAGLRQDLLASIKDPEYKLASLDLDPGERWDYTVGSKGTLVALTGGERASTLFRYVLKSGEPLSLIFPVFFRKEKGQYIITR